MNIEEIKVRLDNLQNGKTVKKFATMDFATQYVMDYNLDVTYLLNLIESVEQDLSIIANSENVSSMNSIAEEALKVIRGN